MAPASQFEVSNPPGDLISAVAFAPDTSSRLLVASWDRAAYLYEIAEDGEAAGLVRSFPHPAPVLDVCFGADGDEAFSAGMDWAVRRIDLATGEQTIMSKHAAPARCVVYSPEQSLLISASWDNTLHVHSTASFSPSPLTVPLPGKPHALAASPSKLVVAMTARLVHIYDLPTLAGLVVASNRGDDDDDEDIAKPKPVPAWQQRESSLKFLTRAVACMPSDAGYATSSIEGRVAVEWFEDTPESQARKYAFKCHRQQADESSSGAGGGGGSGGGGGGDIVYPVNALAFHPVHGTFASGGGDGTVALWDSEAKRRMRQYQRFPDSVAALAFSRDGRFLAVGVSAGFETGMEDYSSAGRTRLFIRELAEAEAKGKGSK